MYSAKQWNILFHSTHILLMLPYSNPASLQSVFMYMSILYFSSIDEAVLFVSAGNWAKCYFYSSRAADHGLRSKPLQHVHPGWVSSTLFIVLHSGYCYSYRHMHTCGTKLMSVFLDIIIMPFRQENNEQNSFQSVMWRQLQDEMVMVQLTKFPKSHCRARPLTAA